MNEFPFTDEEWFRVREAARAVLNATLAEQDSLHAYQFKELQTVLFALKRKYGKHPILLETEADFTDDPTDRVWLYEQAKQAALAGGLLTYTIRISLARLWLEEREDAGRARQELLACRGEVAAWANAGEREEWNELHTECCRGRK
jgi:hypothetical protein